MRRLGLGGDIDAFFAGMTVPALLIQIFGNALTSVLVPMVAVRERHEAGTLAWTYAWLVGGAAALTAVVLGVLAPLWLAPVAPGFAAPERALAVSLTRIQLLAMVGLAVNAVLIAAWQGRGRFIAPVAFGIVAATAAAALQVALIDRVGVRVLAWGQVTLAWGTAVLLLPGLGAPRLPVRHPDIAEAWRRLKPLLAGSAYFRTDLLVSRMLASFLPPGGLSMISLAQRIHNAGAGVLSSGLATPLIPELAQAGAARNWRRFAVLARSGLVRMALVTLGGAAALALLGRPVLALMLGSHRLTGAQLSSLWIVLIALSGVLVGGGLGQVYANVFFALGDTRTPTVIGMIGFTAGVAARIAGVVWLGVYGLAVAITLHFLFTAALYERQLRRLLRRHAAEAPAGAG